jgi:hypothetical protein
MPSLAAKPPTLLDVVNEVQSPPLNFNAPPRRDPLPQFPQPAISPALARQLQLQLDKRNNWALMTPEEIFGLPMQEKIPGITDRDAFGQPKDESVVARFYERQDQSRARTNSENFGALDLASRWGFSGSREPLLNPDILIPGSSRPENLALMDQFLNGTPGNRPESTPDPNSGWSKSFGMPAPTPGPTPEQQAAMEQFQRLLQPHSLPGDAAKSPTFSSLSTALKPAPGQFVSTPIGASFTPLSSGIAMPSGVAPLPGIFGPTNAAPPVFAPEWKPQLPPWMSSSPHLGVVPQRKF